MIYFDNAATSWPKPEGVYIAVEKAMREWGGNPGRSGHRMSLKAGGVIEETRSLLARLFNIADKERIVFTLNATEAINLALKGLLNPGDHVISGAMEHNAVARPLEALKGKGVEVTKVPISGRTEVTASEIEMAMRNNTKMVVLNHASNVTGAINPIKEIGMLCRRKGVLFLVDAAQSAGYLPVDVQGMSIDLLAFPGHKGLFGPQGVGGLYMSTGICPSPIIEGGTGSDSQSLIQPEYSPDRYESGTPNTPGIAGLGEGIRFIVNEGLENIRAKEISLTERLLSGLQNIPGITLYGPPLGIERAPVVSINVSGIDSLEVALILDHAYDIAVRAGLHCAPDAHKVLGTLDSGTVRLSLSYFNTEEEVDICLEALASIAGESV